MRSSLTNPSPSKSNYVNFLGKLFNVILVKEERPPLQKSAAWLIGPTDRARSPSSIPLFLAGARSFLFELHALHIDLFLHQQGLDTTTPAGKAMFQMMGLANGAKRRVGNAHESFSGNSMSAYRIL